MSVADSDVHKVSLKVFEGPLDLLLYLVRKNEVDIYDIPIESITRQYMEHLNLMQALDVNIAGEFMVMAATLMLIKSRMLLPVEERPPDEEEEEDPRAELVRQLIEYKRYKDAAGHLLDLERCRENIFGVGAVWRMLQQEEPSVRLQDVSLFDLVRALGEVLRRAPPEEPPTVEGHHLTVEECVRLILARVADGGEVRFKDLFPPEATRMEIVCTFTALLELIRLRRLVVRQHCLFGEIWIQAADGAAGVHDAEAGNLNAGIADPDGINQERPL